MVISGKVKFFKKKYQITNPTYVVPSKEESYVNKDYSKIFINRRFNRKSIQKIIEKVLENVPKFRGMA